MPPSNSNSKAARSNLGKVEEEEEYIYTPTERNVFAPSPYKDKLLPLWRFRTPKDARKSADAIWAVFLDYEKEDDFIGMDKARKFLQMGMTRAKRYANHKGGRKYASKSSPDAKDAEEEKGQADRRQKKEASLIFREVWERAKTWDGYVERKEEFLKVQRDRAKARKHRSETDTDG